jgi:hypothetical protein
MTPPGFETVSSMDAILCVRYASHTKLMTGSSPVNYRGSLMLEF